ncbi:hypothetical protein [Sphaerisporangium sp. NPDC051011]|uniref:hypothetical protein n=1 Tax=Sphaerisporangium sp. NPDC051011 TaxID=3155792 RepID=UPI003406468C
MMEHSAWFSLLSAAIAGGVTLFDMDQTFVAGDTTGYRIHRSPWWWGFIVANCAIAAVVFFGLRDLRTFEDWNPWLFAASVGVSYLAIVRLKFATVSYQNSDIPVGLDTFYESGRQFVFKRINEAIKTDRARLARRLIAENDLKSLGNQVRLDVDLDALLTPEEKKTRLAWLLKVLQDPGFDEEQKKHTLAVYLASGTQA